MPTSLEKFQNLLRELFQFEDAAELDFGIYRVMKLRRDRMEQWLTGDLPARAKEIIDGSSPTFDSDLAQRLEGLRAQIQAVQHDAIDADGNLVALQTSDAGKEYAKLFAQHQRAPVRSTVDLEILVYNHLYDFFSRYYDSGDFIAKRRWSFAPDGRDTYAVPWNGEEVVLHWANKDQYYIKTGEHFTHYRWESLIGEHMFKIEFQLTDADLPANNNKDAKKKFYLPVPDKLVWDETDSTLIVPFHWRGLVPQDHIEARQEEKIRQNVNDATRERLLAHAIVTAVPHLVTALMAPKKDAAGNTVRDKDDNPVPLLRYHLNRWTRKNESDFFIHKDLRRFLVGELDYFLKSVVLNLDNMLAAGELRAEPNFRLLEAVKKFGTEIIDFLAQLENFQKALFEKKKFIVETSWCLTLDRIPAALKEEVFEAILSNDQQWEEWEKLYKLSALPNDLITPQLRTREFLEVFPYLMLDTVVGYDRALVQKLIGGIESLDRQTDGLIIHSENFQALNLLQERYREAVNSIYIDPPYNTDAAPIDYKNGYKSSTWVAMIQNRVRSSKSLLADDGVFAAAIDDEQQKELSFLLSDIFAENILGTICVRSNPSGRPTKKGYAVSHDYILFAGKSGKSFIGRLPASDEQMERFSQEDTIGPFEWRNLRREGSNSDRFARRFLFYPIYIEGDKIRVPKMEWDGDEEEWRILEKPKSTEDVVYPTNEAGDEKTWRWEWSAVMDSLEELSVRKDRSGRNYVYYKRRPHEAGMVSVSSWFDAKYSATEHGTAVLKKLFGKSPFSFPKSVYAVQDTVYVSGAAQISSVTLDFFAGSGTTGHAVINLNRCDGGSRKYILTEMGGYFDTVLKPRLLKVAFSQDWKKALPLTQENREDSGNPYNGVSHCLKLLRLESYEDALDNIDFDTTAAPGDELPIEFRRNYELRYALNWESRECPTRLAVESLETPFDYTLTLRRETGTETIKPDVPETFLYLIGLHTRRRFWTKRGDHDYLIYTGTLHSNGTEIAVLWRTCRDWNEEEFQKEKVWWHEQRETLAPGARRLYVNAACAIEGHLCLDLEFKKRMHSSYATV